jgi:ABC-2 type transport system ATP-binding protein
MLAEANRIPLGRVAEVLDLVGLGSFAGQRAGKFSQGMSQRLGIAAAPSTRSSGCSRWRSARR